MKYLSVCSGIEAASVAWHGLGWKPFAFSEIEPFPSAVLAHHYPDTPNLGDMTKFEEWPDADIDVLVGGTPCQSFSVAGLRGGLDDQRGNLMLVFGEIARRYRPSWICWENVPGVLSSDGGRDFASLLGLLSGRRIEVPSGGWQNAGNVEGYEGAYGLAWRVLDAQYVRVDSHPRAVPQRRRRVFVIGYIGDWRRAAAVLFERESVSGHPAPRRKAGQVAPTIPSRSTGGGGLGTDFDCDGGLITGTLNSAGGHAYPGQTVQDASAGFLIPSVAETLLGTDHKGPGHNRDHNFVAHALCGEGFDASEDGTGRGTPIVPVTYSIMPMNSGKDYKARPVDVAQPIMAGGPVGGNQGGDYVLQPVAFSSIDSGHDVQNGITPTLRKGGDGGYGQGMAVMQSVAFTQNTRDEVRLIGGDGKIVGALAAESGTKQQSYIKTDMAVRRLTPVECECLQGFPDNYTDVPYRNKPASDGPRYKALGNSMAVNCMRWIGQRIKAVSELN